MSDDEPAPPPPLPAYRPGPAGAGPEDEPSGRPPQQMSDQLSDSERRRALRSLEARAGFRSHLTVYLLVMLLLTGIWAVTTGPHGFFWPVFPMMGWGLGVAIHGASVLWDREPTEEEVRAEAERLRHRARGRLEP